MKENLKIHSFCLVALYILGNAVILLPDKTADENTLFGFLAVFILSLGFCLIAPFYKVFFTENHRKLKAIVFLAVAVFSFWVAADSFESSFSFISGVVLPKSSKPLIILVFLGVVIYFAFRSQKNLLKFSLLAFSATLILVIFFFLASFNNYDLDNLSISFPSFEEIYKNAKPYFLNPFLSILLLPFYFLFVFEKVSAKNITIGVTIGFFSLFLCFASSILLFGPFFAGELEYPFASAVSTVTVGKLYARMDGLSYFIYFFSALIKITVCLKITMSSLKKIRQCI